MSEEKVTVITVVYNLIKSGLEDCLQVDQIDELVEKAVVTEVDNKEEIK